MALTSYSELKTSVADWLNRSDLTSVIPDFITLAENEMSRRLRRTSRRETISIAADATTMPCAAAELRSIYLVTGTPTLDKPLRIGTPEMVAEERAYRGDVAGRPIIACITSAGKELLVAPSPDATYSAEVIYFALLQPLSSTNTVNDELREAPDLYLFGAMAQAELYLEHDERAAFWQEKFDKAIQQLNEVREREEFSANLRPSRLPVVFS